MKPIQQAITGDISKDTNEEHINQAIYEALHQFYKAFNEQDFELMKHNWMNDEIIAMDNPLGGIKRGWDEIKEVYKKIFLGQASVYVEYYDYTIINIDGGFCAVGREKGYVKIYDTKLDLAIRTSRIYKEVEGRYKQVHHHGSIEDPKLLERYQILVNKG